ncbi:MAG: hypothetical protein B6D44_03290 [Ignavibacteriales bacterium UTCHB2]|jgi:type I restriction enzyme S subunit|nr:MAG: putative type I restriction enzyme specificity protein MPN_638 [Ignavibacteria bacterium ADurb.Bin266]OQY74809.1 MAG: hypothetical protein B6D44_03290 [Ignavibacteriales bacterium UTCHB2]HQI40802.1 restriction endonuclease subunit S [Ignavibacteriaceae bacterium]HQJ46057.1 restriction endonuclease subunit S [Ignavibacteriaceae bacterium]
MDPFKQTDIGLIPEDWGLNKLSETSEIIMGQSPPSSTYNSNGNGLPFYQGKTDFGSIYPKPRIWCTSPSKIAEKNDILISVRAPVGPTNLSFEKSGIGRGLSAIRVKQNDYLYLYYYLKKIENEIEKLGTGSTFKAINKSQLHNIKIPLPPLSEQKKIAYVLSKIQQAIEKQEQIIKTTQELKKALMQKLFTEGLYGEPQKHTEIGPIPESWEVVPFERVAKLQGGYGFRSTDKVIVSNTQLIRMGNLYQNLLQLDRSPVFYPNSFTEEYPAYVLYENDLIISLTGTMGKEDYGFVVKVPKILNRKLLLNQRVARILLNEKLQLDLDYFYYFLLTRKFLDKLYRTAKGTKQANLSVKEIYNLKVAYPAKSEQVKIGKLLTTLDKKIKSTSEILVQYKHFLTSALNKLVTGQIRVKDIEFKLAG